MTSPILRLLGAIAGLGSVVLWWFLGSTVAPSIRKHTLFQMGSSRLALFAFLFVPALILAVVALYWVPPRLQDSGPIPEGKRWRLALVVLFLIALALGLAH
jgi:hypothetical protein